MPDRRNCFLTGCDRTRHRSEHHDLPPSRDLLPWGQSPDGTADRRGCRSASSMPTLGGLLPYAMGTSNG
jgi:hypothetical protein